MPISMWRNIPRLQNPLYQPAHFVLFHSTPASLAKWKSKWNNKDEGGGQQPPKNYIRYVVRQKRADAKKALKDLLLNGTRSKLSFQDEDITMRASEIRSRNTKLRDSSDDFDYQTQSEESGKSKPHHSSRKNKRSGSKRRQSKNSFCNEDDDRHPETVFQAAFGNRCYTWSFRSWDGYNFQSATAGFEWRDGPSWTTRNRRVETNENDDDSNWVKNRRRAWGTSESDDDVESSIMGSYSDRLVLGLPPSGPLKIDDVKSAFRASALKWHPDKHQGPSQVMAEEKFKLCVDAYKSLCSALSSA